MSQNVELARQLYAAWNRGDDEWFADHLAEDFELRPIVGFSGLDEVYRGKEGWRRFAGTWREAWEDITVGIERIGEVGERTFALIIFAGRGKESGAEVTLRAGHVATIKNGKIVELLAVQGWDETLEAVGLQPRS